ncbi:MAG: TIGR00730 family Rossman fold protein [Cytophagales bacterium]|nr:TIGR00730 family Rossman fold protein [Bernardetiaceae bacterium]MDW8210163.1 TIGR00730 family Rossman fold protein [Cytophagales bacterium]
MAKNEDNNERRFLEGPRSRWSELIFTIKVLADFIRGFRKLHFVGPCVTVFGSARFQEHHPYYQMARQIGRELAKMGFTVMTGGGPGIMEAANRGAKEAGGYSVGCNIKLPHEQSHNPYMDRWVTMEYFFVRKVLLLKYSYAFVVMPGGAGTMDELFETLTLIQTKKIANFPIVLIGCSYWHKLIEFMEMMVQQGTLSPEDLNLICLTDSIEDAMNHIRKYAIEQFNLTYKRIKPIPWLGEQIAKVRMKLEA